VANEDSLDAAIIIAVGSNLAGRYASSEALVEAAVARLPSLAVEVTRRSRPWRSAAWPDAAEPNFVNAVAFIATPLPPRSLLAALLGLEAEFGRFRVTGGGPRTLDLDLIAYGRLGIASAGIALPHPRAAQRGFVMGPLAEIAPGWRHPISGETAAELFRQATIGADARPSDG
jgi:2-amino-4-hydroxy-6-hydroxymethyldihydropteridine diphosphokinase